MLKRRRLHGLQHQSRRSDAQRRCRWRYAAPLSVVNATLSKRKESIMVQKTGRAKRGKKGLLTPDICVLASVVPLVVVGGRARVV
jgi:hypothetical protein